MAKKTSPIKKDEEIRKHPDQHIDQDFDGFPGATSTREHITLRTGEQKKTAVLTKKGQKKHMVINHIRQSII